MQEKEREREKKERRNSKITEQKTGSTFVERCVLEQKRCKEILINGTYLTVNLETQPPAEHTHYRAFFVLFLLFFIYEPTIRHFVKLFIYQNRVGK